MKRRYILLIILVLLSNTAIWSQMFSIQDIETGRRTYLKPANLSGLQWIPNANTYQYESEDTLFLVSVDGKESVITITPQQLNSLLKLPENKQFKSLPELSFFNENELFIRSGINGYFLNFETKQFIEFTLEHGADSILLNPAAIGIAYNAKANIYIVDAKGNTTQITHDTAAWVYNGNLVYRREFGITRGKHWSPDGKYLLYYKCNKQQVEKYPIVKIGYPMAELKPEPYPMAGRTMEETSLWVYSIADNKNTKLNIAEDAGVYHTNPSWMQSSGLLAIQHLNRGQDTLRVRLYNAETGEMQADLFSETHPKYTEPEFPLVLVKKSEALYLSQQSGYNHIYLVDMTTGKRNQLTRGEWEVKELLGVDAKTQNVYFTANKTNPLETQLYVINIKSKKLQQLTQHVGTHTIQFSDDWKYYTDEYSNYTTPRHINLCNANGSVAEVLLEAKNPIGKYQLADTEINTILSADGKTELYYKLTKPLNFDSTKQYPVVVYIYGGPHVQLIKNEWMDRIAYLQQYFAQHGYASFMVDCRGSDYRGAAFENVIYRQLGIPQLEDYKAGIDFLSGINWVDTTRIGIHGWSFGGFMTISLMEEYPEIFKVGVAGGPVTDWKLYEVMYGERYMDTPAENPEGYKLTNLNDKVDQLHGKLLVIHGALDPVVVWQNSLELIQAGIKEDKLIDYFVYPYHEHNVRGKDREHLTKMITEYFFEHL